MSRKSRGNPRMLSNVLQAVVDLKDVNGSTAKRILEQVQSVVNVSNVKLKPRHVETQVKKALRHAVETGILKMRAGKYKFALRQGNSSSSAKKGKASHKARSHKKKKSEGEEENKSGRRCKKPDRRQRQRLQRKRKPCKRKRSHSDSPTTTNTRCSTYHEDSSSVYHRRVDSDHDHVKRRSSRRKRPNKKNVRITQPKRRRGRKRKVKRRCTPIPTMHPDKSLGGLDDDTQSSNSKKGGDLLQDDYAPQNLPDFPQDGYADPVECDNPYCLCNLKQEPFDDGHYDGPNCSHFM